MGKFVSLEHIESVLEEYPSSNTNKMRMAIKGEVIYDENDIRSPRGILNALIAFVGTFIGAFCATLFLLNK